MERCHSLHWDIAQPPALTRRVTATAVTTRSAALHCRVEVCCRLAATACAARTHYIRYYSYGNQKQHRRERRHQHTGTRPAAARDTDIPHHYTTTPHSTARTHVRECMNGLNKAKCVMSPRGACTTLDKRFPALVYHHAVGVWMRVCEGEGVGRGAATHLARTRSVQRGH